MNNTIEGYRLIRVDANELSKAVQSAITDGWQPYGNASFIESWNGISKYICAYQPIVKYVNPCAQKESGVKKLPIVDPKNLE